MPAGQQEKDLVYHYDHLGSIESISTAFVTPPPAYAADGLGNKGQFSEDAWGMRRNPYTWSGAPVTSGTNASDDGGSDSLTPRGFTGHEMLDGLGLVHMNGRIYDPLLGRFLSADVMVQAPGNLQAYNRYSYVLNRPLSLTDPSGFAFSDSDNGPEAEARRKLAETTKKVLQNTRVQGGLKVVGAFGEGAAAIGLAAAPEPTMATKAAAVVVGTHAVDLGAAGLNQLVTGQDTKTLTNQVASSTASALGASPQTAAHAGNMADAIPGTMAAAQGLGQMLENRVVAAAPKAGAAAGEVSAAPATAEAGKDANIVFRRVSDAERKTFGTQGLKPTGPDAAVTPTQHIADGAKPSPFISSTRDFDVAMGSYSRGGTPVVEIDLSKVSAPHIDFTNPANLDLLSSSKAIYNATRDAEVLINGPVSAEAIGRIHYP